MIRVLSLKISTLAILKSWKILFSKKIINFQNFLSDSESARQAESESRRKKNGKRKRNKEIDLRLNTLPMIGDFQFKSLCQKAVCKSHKIYFLEQFCILDQFEQKNYRRKWRPIFTSKSNKSRKPMTHKLWLIICHTQILISIDT